MAVATGDYVIPFLVSGISIVFCGLMLSFIPYLQKLNARTAKKASENIELQQC